MRKLLTETTPDAENRSRMKSVAEQGTAAFTSALTPRPLV